MDTNAQKNANTVPEEEPVKWYSYVVLILAILFFSGVFAKAGNWLQVLDFSVLDGSFGNVALPAGKVGIFRGIGGSGAKEGFGFALTLMPAAILALGVVGVVEGLGGLKAAQKLMTPLLKPLLGIPGICGLALIASLQSTDAGAGMAKELYQKNEITDEERTAFCMFQITADGSITNYFSSGSGIFSLLLVAPIVPLLVCFIFKVFSANIIRLYIKLMKRKLSAQAK